MNLYQLMGKGLSFGAGMAKRAVTAHPLAKTATWSAAGAAYGAYQGYDPTSRIEGAAKGAVLGAMGGALVGFGPKAMFGWKTGKITKGHTFIGPLQKGVKRAVTKDVEQRRLGLLQMGWRANQWAGSKHATQGAKTALGQGIRNYRSSPIAATLGLGGEAIKGGIRAGKFALDHPVGLAAGAAATYGVYSGISSLAEEQGQAQSMESPALQGVAMKANWEQESMQKADEMGQIGGGTIGPAQVMQQQFDYANYLDTVKTVASHSRTAKFAESTVGLPQGLHAGRHG